MNQDPPAPVIPERLLLLRRAGFAALGLAFLCATLQSLLSWALLPDRVASHFDARGNADGYMGRGRFVALVTGLQVLLTLLFSGLALALPRLPAALINIPSRSWWLAPERRGRTMAFVSAWVAWLGAATLLLLAALFRLTVQAHRGEVPPRLPGAFWWLLGAYLLLLLLFLLFWLWTFRLPPEARSQET